MMGQGFGGAQSIVLLKTGVLSQVCVIGFKKFFVRTFPVVIVPPGSIGTPALRPPVGTLPGPKALLKAMNDCQFTVSYTSPAPPRITVDPLPFISQANPKRGGTFF